MTTIKPLDVFEEFPGAKRFCENYANQKHSKLPPGCGNLYVIQTINRAGEVTSERYAMNLITNRGMYTSESNRYSIFSAPNSQSQKSQGIRNMYIGSGTTPPAATDTALVSQLTTITPDFSMASSVTYLYKCEYDSETDIIYQRARVGKYTYDYNISGITSDITINEIGLSYYSNALFIRMLVYNDQGVQEGIVKHPDEKLIIYVYMAAAMKASFIQNLWSQGYYGIFQPAFMMCQTGASGFNADQYSGSIYMFALNALSIQSANDYGAPVTYLTKAALNGNHIFNPGSSQYYTASVTFANNVLTCESASLTETDVITNNHFYLTTEAFCGRTSGSPSIYWMSPFFVLKEQKLSSPETIVSEKVYTDSQKALTLASTFGKRYSFATQEGELPVVDFNMTSSYMYNHHPDHKGWDIADTFVNEPNTYYGNMGIGGAYAYLDESFVVHINQKVGADDPYITEITTDTGTDVPLYCTDTYWDYNSYEAIVDPHNIPQSQGKKRYYAHKSSAISDLFYHYDQPVHRLVESNGPHVIANSDAGSTNLVVDASSQYHAVIAGSRLFHIGNNGEIDYTYDLKWHDNTLNCSPFWHWFFGSKLLVVGPYAGPISEVRVYDVSDLTSAPSYTDVDFQIGEELWNSSSSFTARMNGYWTFSDNGWFGSYNHDNNEAAVLNMTDLTFEKFSNVSFFHVQQYTDYVFYCETGSSPEVWHVYNASTQTEYDTFELPAGYTTTGVMGCGDNMYITVVHTASDTRYTYLYQIASKYLSQMAESYIALTFSVTSVSSTSDRGEKIPITDTSGATTISSADDKKNRCVPVVYSREGIVFNQRWSVSSSNYATMAVMILADNPTEQLQLYKWPDTSTSSVSNYTNRLYLSRWNRIFSIDGTNTNQTILISMPWVTKSSNSYRASVSTSSRRGYNVIQVDDIGYFVDNKSAEYRVNQRDGYGYYWWVTGGSSVCTASATVYGNGIIGYEFDSATTGHLYWAPLSTFLPHKVTGTTYTIQTFNNPRSFKFGGYSASITNDTSKWSLS